MSKMYMAMRFVTEMTVHTGQTVAFDKSDTMIGVIPVFATKKAARGVYGKDVELVEVTFSDKKEG